MFPDSGSSLFSSLSGSSLAHYNVGRKRSVKSQKIEMETALDLYQFATQIKPNDCDAQNRVLPPEEKVADVLSFVLFRQVELQNALVQKLAF